MEETVKSLFGLNAEQIADTLSLEKSYQGKVVYQWLVKGASSFAEMTNLSKLDRIRLESFPIFSSSIEEEQTDETGAEKLGIRLYDGKIVECVVLIDRKGNRTACLSSQVGCAMECAFCRTGTMGFVRNLYGFEIIEQFMHLQKRGDISHIVFMGMGEPLANLDEVLKAIEYFHDPEGTNMSHRRITISTCGIIPGLRRLTALGLPVKLAVSLVTADNNKRSDLMTINRKYPLNALKIALQEFQRMSGRRFTFECCLMKDVNTFGSDAARLATYCRGLDVIINLIPYNEAAELSWETPDENEISQFEDMLTSKGLSLTRRTSRGRGINGACGQLAVKMDNENKE